MALPGAGLSEGSRSGSWAGVGGLLFVDEPGVFLNGHLLNMVSLRLVVCMYRMR